MTTVKINILILSMATLTFTSCSKQNKSSNTLNTSTSNSSKIFGGVLAEETFQKENGIVGLVGFSTDAANIKPDGSVDPNASYSLSICSGTLIDKNIVLTAAHCSTSMSTDSVLVAIAVNFKLDLTQDLTNFDFKDAIFVDKILVNQDFLKGFNNSMETDSISWNDIALLRLSTNAPTTFQFEKLASSSDMKTIENAKTAILSGFGVANSIVNKLIIDPITKKPVITAVPEKTPTSGILRKVENQNIVKLVSDAGKDIVFDQSKDTGSCHGDSGGPAFVKQTDGSLLQIGVASRGTEKTGNCIERGVFTNVAVQRNWIDSAIQAILK